MTAKRKPATTSAPVSINARSVDTKRVIRISNGGDAAAFGGFEPGRNTNEWRQYTFGRLLLFVFNAYEMQILESYRAAGFEEIRQVHFAIMRHIDASRGTRITDLAARAGVTKGAMGQLVVECEKLGIVKSAADPADARAKLVALSARGRKLMAVTHRSSAAIEKAFAKQIGVKKFAALREGLVALRETMPR